MNYDDETLMSYADGELDAAKRAEIAAALQRDPELARRVASPNGTTEAGLSVLDREGVLDQLVAVAIEAAARRGEELANEAKLASLASEGSLH